MSIHTPDPRKPGRPPRDDESATAWIQSRTTMDRKNAYVRTAQAAGESLTGWMFRHLDKAAKYSPKDAP